jgi:SAM-dependent methyltransferase
MDTRTTKNLLNKQSLITGEPVVKILDFGMHPYADTFVGEDQLSLTEPVLPLQCYLDEEIGLIQLGYLTDDYDRYNLYAYSYTSSNSKFARDHWDAYYATMKEKFNIVNDLIVEIGSNDGYLAKQFLKDTNVVVGVDPSVEMCRIAESEGIEIFNGLFNSDSAMQLRKMHGKAKLIIANNVFNHSNDPLDFVKAVSKLLQNDGVFVFESPYWGDTVNSMKFDQIYHEHITYLTLKSAFHLLVLAGLEIFDFEIVDYHGGSLRIYARKNFNSSIPPIKKVIDFIDKEISQGLYDVEFYKEWQLKLLAKRNKFLVYLYQLKLENPNTPFIGIGAAAKANTFLNYYNLDSTVLDYITDSSPHKKGKYTPLTRIPIVGDEIFSQYDDVFALILSWNISDNLKKVLLEINPKIKFITI